MDAACDDISNRRCEPETRGDFHPEEWAIGYRASVEAEQLMRGTSPNETIAEEVQVMRNACLSGGLNAESAENRARALAGLSSAGWLVPPAKPWSERSTT